MIDALNELLSPKRVRTDAEALASWGRDWTRSFAVAPSAIVFPESVDDVVKLVRAANERRWSLVPSGGRTGLSGGAVASNGEIVVSFDRMNRILDFNEADRIVRCQAGVVTGTLQDYAAERGLFYPVDFASSGSSQIGGNISTNAGGNRVIRYGMTRDLILGLEVVTADGTVLKGLRKYIKNNTGIDLKQLFIGSEGILGVVTRAALRVFPAPAERQVALCALPSFGQVTAFLRMAREGLGGELTAFEVMWNAYYRLTVERVKGVAGPLPTHHPFYVLLEASGSDPERIHADLEKLLESAMGDNLILDATLSTSNASAAAIWRIRDSSVELGRSFPYAARMGFDVSLAIDRMEEYADTLDARVKAIDPQAFTIVMGHVGDGNLHPSVYHEHTPEKHDEFEKLVYDLTGEFGGSISAEHGIGILKRPYLKMSRTEEEIETMRTLKRALDPKNILNPGRIFTL
jgi:FAD/FMN-containing dehydrogenase